jgi:hypothetical protein
MASWMARVVGRVVAPKARTSRLGPGQSGDPAHTDDLEESRSN